MFHKFHPLRTSSSTTDIKRKHADFHPFPQHLALILLNNRIHEICYKSFAVTLGVVFDCFGIHALPRQPPSEKRQSASGGKLGAFAFGQWLLAQWSAHGDTADVVLTLLRILSLDWNF